MQLGSAWSKGTDGRVKLVIFAGGQQGSESTVVRRMRPGVDQLQAALLMQPGLAEIDDSFNVFAIPFFFESNEELRHMTEKLTPVIRQRIEPKGFRLLNWSHGGLVRVFSRRELRTLADVKRVKLFTTEGYARWVQWYTANGFNPVPLPPNEVATQLKIKAGMIDAVPSPPYGALALQFFRDAPYVLDVAVGPLVGATIVTREAWTRIGEADRATLLDGAGRMEQSLAPEIDKLDASSMTAMEKVGLKVTKVDPSAAREFREAGQKLGASMRGSMVPEDVYDLALKERAAFRQAKGEGP
jgi:TRAP-type C4-dicarboxylate transport system substrate-binding protein